MPIQKRLVLVGAGQAHLYSLKRTHHFVRKGAQVTLVSPSRYLYYSGMGPGMISRIYKPDQLRFDVKALTESGGGTFVEDRVSAVDPDLRRLELDSGQQLAYDLVSFNVGSEASPNCPVSDQCACFTAKPIENLEKVRKAVLELGTNGVAQITVVGGGPAGVELAGNLAQLVKNRRQRAQITLVNRDDRLLPTLPAQAAQLAERSLAERGVAIAHRFRVAFLASGQIESGDGDAIACDIAIIATGVVPPALFARSQLSTTPDGALLVNNCLQSPEHFEIFGGGDCIAIADSPLARLGVHAVRQAPILYHNLLASVEEKPLRAYVPPQHAGLILNMGDGTGLLIWKSRAWRGRLAFVLKHWFDAWFVSRLYH